MFRVLVTSLCVLILSGCVMVDSLMMNPVHTVKNLTQSVCDIEGLRVGLTEQQLRARRITTAYRRSDTATKPTTVQVVRYVRGEPYYLNISFRDGVVYSWFIEDVDCVK